MIETEGFNDVYLFKVRKRYEMKLTKMSYQSMHSKYTTYQWHRCSNRGEHRC
jgi:hypothetical protein